MRRTILVVAIALLPAACDGAETSGRPRIIDGDTLRLGAETIRLEGIDAPEIKQRCRDGAGAPYACGAIASRVLARLTGGGAVTCRGDARDRYGRLLATCEAGGTNLNRAMVQAGWALAFRRYSHRYLADEREASSERRGMWSGSFQEPWAWRTAAQARPMPSVRPEVIKAETSRCRIKGNVSASGRIYHVPGSPHYADTRIDPSRGERWFCSVAEARRAGWRAPRG